MNHEFAELSFTDPKRGIWWSLFHSVRHDISGTKRTARARRAETKPELERRQAALFALARASLTSDATLKFAMVPEQDNPADAVLRTERESRAYRYEPVQLKEVVPEDVNPQQTLQGLLESVRTAYGSSQPMTIAIHLNRNQTTKLGSISAPSLPAITFWLFGLCGPNRGFLVSDPFAQFEVHEFDIPKAPSSMTDW